MTILILTKPGANIIRDKPRLQTIQLVLQEQFDS